MNRDVFPEEAAGKFAAVYPLQPTHLTHRLVGHPLLELDALSALAARMDPYTIEHNAAVDLPLGISNAETPSNGLSAIETIATIDRCGSWVLLKHIQQDPDYRDLLHGVLAQLKQQIEPVTGPMLQLEGFIFISSPDAVTPLHFDPEYNILFQIRGSKTMTVFPADDREIVTQLFHEQYFAGGPRNLPWQEKFKPRGRPIHIAPGEAIYVPILAPHWVKTHGEVSVSLSLTWRSEWSFHHADAQRFNRTLRKFGLSPAEPRPYPSGNLAKSVAHRALKKAGSLLRRGA
jgi:quercetin dioxygenase-like cupin family protein